MFWINYKLSLNFDIYTWIKETHLHQYLYWYWPPVGISQALITTIETFIFLLNINPAVLLKQSSILKRT